MNIKDKKQYPDFQEVKGLLLSRGADMQLRDNGNTVGDLLNK